MTQTTRDLLSDLRQMSGIVGQTAIRAAEEIERLRALVNKLEIEILGIEYENGHRR